MKVSDLITILQNMLELHGDVRVVTPTPTGVPGEIIDDTPIIESYSGVLIIRPDAVDEPVSDDSQEEFIDEVEEE